MSKFIVVEAHVTTTEIYSSYEEALKEAESCHTDGEEVAIYEVTKKFTPTKVVFQKEEI